MSLIRKYDSGYAKRLKKRKVEQLAQKKEKLLIDLLLNNHNVQ